MERPRAKRISLAILVTGLAAAVVIYAVAEPPPPDPLGYDRLANKRYVLELERLGGKANVMTAEFMAWFGDLWRGQNLAFTVAALSAATAALFWYIATFPPESAPAAEPVAGRSGSDADHRS